MRKSSPSTMARDSTADIVRTFAGKDPALRLVGNPGNRGKGYSVRNGMLNARGRIVLFSDADLSSPIEKAPKLLKALERARMSPSAPDGCVLKRRFSGNRCTGNSSDESSTCCCASSWGCSSRTHNAASKPSSN
jgi:glycosyltransferase involved in cell wall biosynthesis